VQRELDPQPVGSFGKSTHKCDRGLQVGCRLGVCQLLDGLLRCQAQVFNRLGHIVAMAVMTSKVGVVVFEPVPIQRLDGGTRASMQKAAALDKYRIEPLRSTPQWLGARDSQPQCLRSAKPAIV